MQKKVSRGKMYGLWITMMIFISGRATVWPLLEGHRSAREVAIFGLLLLVYLLGYSGGRATEGGQNPPGRTDSPASDPSA